MRRSDIINKNMEGFYCRFLGGLVNVKNQDGLTKVLDMVPDFVNRFAPGGDNSADETVDSEEN